MEKICLFFASDYHFEMISLPYINKEIQEDKDIIIISENNLENTIKKVLKNLNIKNEDKQKIMSLNWNNDFNKLNNIQQEKGKEKEKVIFIKGNKNYIDKINEKIDLLEIDNGIKLINCYDINEVNNDMNSIVNKYNKILNTSGECMI